MQGSFYIAREKKKVTTFLVPVHYLLLSEAISALYPGLLSDDLIRPDNFGMVHLPGILSAAKFPQLIACICRPQGYSTPILTKQRV